MKKQKTSFELVEITWQCPACGRIMKALLHRHPPVDEERSKLMLCKQHILDGCPAYIGLKDQTP